MSESADAASPGARAIALGIDSLMVATSAAAATALLHSSGHSVDELVVIPSAVLAGGVVYATALLWLTDGYTAGKWLMGVRVRSTKATRIAPTAALVRESVRCACEVAGPLWLLDYGLGLFDAAGRTAHDRLGATIVIQRHAIARWRWLVGVATVVGLLYGVHLLLGVSFRSIPDPQRS